MLSLFIVKWFKVRYPPKPNIADFSLLFKNLKSDKMEDLLARIRGKIGEFELEQNLMSLWVVSGGNGFC